MGTEFKDLDTTPTLTLDPFQAADKKETPAVQQVEEPVLDDSVLTEEERQTVEAFAKQIDLTNSSLILQYGAGTQKKMADFSESALDNVKSQDLGEVGALLTGVVTQLKSFDEDEEEKGFFGIFKKASNKIDSMKAKYAKAETNVNEIIKALEKHQVQLMKDTALLDKMYELNLTYFKELSMYILAGKKKLAEVKRTQLADLMSRAQASGLPEDAQAAKDLDEMCIRFEKKIHDLEPQRRVTDVTNELLKKNAEKLKIATTETARQSERGIVDMDTLKATNESLISTLDEVMAIQREGREKRQAAEAELRNMEQELKGKLLQLHG